MSSLTFENVARFNAENAELRPLPMGTAVLCPPGLSRLHSHRISGAWTTATHRAPERFEWPAAVQRSTASRLRPP